MNSDLLTDFNIFFFFLQAKSIHQIAKLRNSDQLKNVMDSIEKYQKSNHMQTSIEGPVEQDPEYQLIVEANNLAVEIDTEIGISF